jgi:hypothetical protein
MRTRRSLRRFHNRQGRGTRPQTGWPDRLVYGAVLKTGSNLEELKTQHAAAVKAAEAENRKKLDDKRKPNSSKTAAVAPPNPAPRRNSGTGNRCSARSR